MATKTKILETSIRLFVDQGFENTPTSQISKEAGVATGTLFHHYSTKEDLINSAYLYVTRQAMKEVKQSDFSDLRSYLEQIWISGMNWSLEHDYYVKFLLSFSRSDYITGSTLIDAEHILRPYFLLMSDSLKQTRVKNLPNHLLIEIYNRMFEVFFTYMCDLGQPDDDMIEQGFQVVWDAITQV